MRVDYPVYPLLPSDLSNGGSNHRAHREHRGRSEAIMFDTQSVRECGNGEGERAKVDVRDMGIHLAGLVWMALRSFVGTMLVLTLAGSILAGLSYYIVSEENWACPA